ncbi:hypothetical protein AAGQ96_15370 [Pantoea sp. MBD-2R]
MQLYQAHLSLTLVADLSQLVWLEALALMQREMVRLQAQSPSVGLLL